MTIDENKALALRLNEASNNRDFKFIGATLSPDIIYHPPTGPDVQGFEAYMQVIQPLLIAMPDIQINIDDLIAEGNQVAMRARVTGTFTGSYQGIPPTNQKVTIHIVSIERFVDGKLVEVWEKYDTLDLMRQLGVIPTPT